MYDAHQAHSPRGSSSSPSKVILQREYREKEGVCFNALRDVIKDITGKEPRTRQEVLKKATDLLSVNSDVKKQNETQGGDLPPHELFSPTYFEGTASAHVPLAAHFAPSPHSSQSWQSGTGFDMAPSIPYYTTSSANVQQYHVMDPAFSLATGSSPHGQDWYNHHR